MDFDLLDVKNLALTFDPDEPTGDPFLDGRYEAHRAEFGHGKPYWRLFYRLCEQYKPSMCCELGAWQGTCAAHMAVHAGTVATIDHHGDRRGERNPDGDDVHEAKCREVMQRYGNVFYIKGWTWDVWPDVRDLGKPIDVLFIDSWHDYPHAILDWTIYRPLLASPALVVCDDILTTDSATISGMVRFWDEASLGSERFLLEGPHAQVPMGFFKWAGR